MKSTRAYVVALGALLTVAFLVSFLTLDNDRGSRPVVNLGPGTEVVHQNLTARRWEEPQWQLDYEIGEPVEDREVFTEREPDFYYLVTGRIGPQGDLFVLDSGDYSVKRISAGTVVTRYGAGQGNGPGEMAGPMDLAVDADGGVWVADPVNGAVIGFEPDGKLGSTVRREVPPARLLRGPQGEIVIASPDAHQGLFYVADDTMEEAGLRFGHLVDQPQHAIAFDGWLAGGNGGGFVYGPLYIGMLFEYDFAGNLRWAAETIDPVPPPKVLLREDGLLVRDPEARPVTYSVSATDQDVFVLSRHPHGTLRSREVVDVYDRSSGQYRHSFQPPGKAKSLVVDPPYLYTLTSTQVQRWRLTTGPEIFRSEPTAAAIVAAMH